jgi:pilus assembly protein CpaE
VTIAPQHPATTRAALRVVVTGHVDGDTDLRLTLDSSPTIEVVAWAAQPEHAAEQLTAPDLAAVLHGTSMEQGGDAGVYFSVLEAEIGAIRRHTDAPVILLVPDAASPPLVGAALAAGVADVLILPQMAETIAFSIEKARFGIARHPGAAAGPRGEVVTVFSPKGGTGKTVLATNLGVHLAKAGGTRVLLVDLDLQFGDAAIMLGLEPERTLSELALAPGELDAGKLAGYTTRHSSGLAILPAPMRPEEAELVSEQKLLEILEVARHAYDVVLVDTSPFFYGPMLATLEPTDHLLVVCGLDVPTLKNVRLSLRTLELLGFPADRLDLVLNRVSPKVGVTRADVEAALETPVRFEIPDDPAVAVAVNRGEPSILSDAGSPFGRAVAEIACAVRPAAKATDTTDTAPETSPRWSLFEGTRRRRRLLEGRA